MVTKKPQKRKEKKRKEKKREEPNLKVSQAVNKQVMPFCCK
jgi:hypothetical protein